MYFVIGSLLSVKKNSNFIIVKNGWPTDTEKLRFQELLSINIIKAADVFKDDMYILPHSTNILQTYT